MSDAKKCDFGCGRYADVTALQLVPDGWIFIGGKSRKIMCPFCTMQQLGISALRGALQSLMGSMGGEPPKDDKVAALIWKRAEDALSSTGVESTASGTRVVLYTPPNVPRQYLGD